jgi:hypothetical protein
MLIISSHQALGVHTARTCKTEHVHITISVWFGHWIIEQLPLCASHHDAESLVPYGVVS